MTKEEFLIQRALGLLDKIIERRFDDNVRSHHKRNTGKDMEEQIRIRNCEMDWIKIPLHVEINSPEYFEFIESKLPD